MLAFTLTPGGNSGMNPAVGIGLLVALTAVAWGVQTYFARRRTRELTAAAQDIGFTFDGRDWTDIRRAPRMETRLFERHGNYRNVMTGSREGMGVSLFDYTYRQGSGRDSRNCTQTVAAFQKTDASIPHFDLWPRGTFDKIKDAFVHENVQFESHPGFSEQCEVHSPVQEDLKRAFSPNMLSFLERLNSAAKWEIEGVGDTLIIYEPAETVDPAGLRSFLDETSSIANTFFGLINATRTETTTANSQAS
jgi:hypothetical protein